MASQAGSENRDLSHNNGDFNEGNDHEMIMKYHGFRGLPYFPTYPHGWFHQQGAEMNTE